MRTASLERNTKETQISVEVNLDGTGIYEISTGIGFLDHMLEQLSRHALMDLKVRAEGDLHIDFHHTTEDTGIAIGEAVAQARRDGHSWAAIAAMLGTSSEAARQRYGRSTRSEAREGVASS